MSYWDALQSDKAKKEYQKYLGGNKGIIKGKGIDNIQNIKGMNKKDVHILLDASYNKKPSNQGNYILDKELSGQRVQVYYNNFTNKAYVVHRGTQGSKDILNDVGLIVGVRGNRFYHAKNIQKLAEQKYGKNNIITLGHSLGGQLTEESTKGQAITYNKPTLPNEILFGNRLNNKNQTNIKTSRDPVSILNNKNDDRNIVIKSKKLNPLHAHSTDRLNGKGIKNNNKSKNNIKLI